MNERRENNCEDRAALLCGDAARDAAIRALTPSLGATQGMRVFAFSEDDVLDQEVMKGQVAHVHFADLPALLETVWRGNIQLDRWLARGVRLHLQDNGGLREVELERVGRVLAETWASYRRRSRRREIAAACVLCGAALLAAAGLLIWTPA